MGRNFYVTLPSNASLKIYPNNTIADYTTWLSQSIDLDDNWLVGLTELIYPITWLTINDGEWFQLIYLAVKHSIVDRGELTGTVTESPETDIGGGRLFLKAGRYETAKDLILHIQELWNENIQKNAVDKQDPIWNPMLTKDALSITFNERTNKVKFVLKDERNALRFSPALADILAINTTADEPARDWRLFDVDTQTEQSDTEVDVNRGRHLLFVYCSLVQDSVVGDVRAPLLRSTIVNGCYGQMIREVFTLPMYVPLKTNHFDNIRIAIKDETGQSIPFNSGISSVTLHFKEDA